MSTTRARSLMPREHGVYAEVAFPLVTAFALGRPSITSILIATSIVCAFLLHEPVVVLLGRRGPKVWRECRSRAQMRATLLAALVLGAGTTGFLRSNALAQYWLLGVAGGAVILGALVYQKQEKSWFGEAMLASLLASASVPVALHSGVGDRIALASAGIWAVVFLLATATVHGMTARAKQKSEWQAVMTVFAALGLATTAVWVALSQHIWWPLALLPVLAVSLVVFVARLSPKDLRRVGWSVAGSNLVTTAILVIALR